MSCQQLDNKITALYVRLKAQTEETLNASQEINH